MTASPEITNLFAPWAQRVGLAMEIVWLLAIFLVPLAFATPAVMGNGYDLPKVTLYRSLIGLLGALWLIEWRSRSGRLYIDFHGLRESRPPNG